MPYQVKDWPIHFENDRSKQRDRCSFVCVPNKQHGMGFSYVMAEKDGAMVYGIWQLIIGACSQQKRPRLGWLTSDGDRNGTAWRVEDLAMKFRRPASEVRRAIEVLCSLKVNWLISVQVPDNNDLPPTPHELTADSPPTHLERKGREGKEENEEKGTLVVSDEPTPASATTDDQWLAGLKADKGYEGLDVDREYARMKRWCVENKKQPTRRRFINWLNRCDKPLASNGATETKPQGIWALSKQLEAIEEQITKIKRRGHEDAFGVNIQEQDKPEYKRLCAERKRLKEAIAKGGA